MMCASYLNLPKHFVHASAKALGLGCAMALMLGAAFAPFSPVTTHVQAEPYSSMENGPKHSFGPDHESKSTKGISGSSGMVDAYGNPVVPYEEEKKPTRRQQLGLDALKPKPSTRPLPDLPEQDAGWKF